MQRMSDTHLHSIPAHICTVVLYAISRLSRALYSQGASD